VAHTTGEMGGTGEKPKRKNRENTNVFRGSSTVFASGRSKRMGDEGLEDVGCGLSETADSEIGGVAGGEVGLDSGLREVVEAWDSLPRDVQSEIVALARKAAGQVDCC